MVNSKYFMAISARVKEPTGGWKYYTGYLIDRETEVNRYDVIAKEKHSIEMSSRLSRATITKNKILSFAKKDHVKRFQQYSVKGFNNDKRLTQYYNWKKMMLGLFAAEVEKRGVDIRNIDLKNVNYIIGEAY